MNGSLAPASIRLTQYSHGGGCGCKIAPAVLSQILANSGAARLLPPELLVGTESSDDAAVYKLNGSQAIVATTDFFMPAAERNWNSYGHDVVIPAHMPGWQHKLLSARKPAAAC